MITKEKIHSNFRLVGCFASESAISGATPNYDPVANDLWFNTTDERFYCYDGTSWLPVGSEQVFTQTVSSVDYKVPIAVAGFTASAKTCADTSNDDVTLGQITILTGNTVQAVIGDIGTATTRRRTCVVNASGGDAYVTVTDQTNTKINGVAKRLLLADNGWAVLEETGNDAFIINSGSGATLVAFAS